MTGRQQFRWFRQDQCRLCGQCLMACPVLELDEATAVAQKKQLLSEKPATALPFRFCTTCNVCDLVCPQQVAPYELILECYDRQAERRGLPYIAKMVLPHEPENIWSALRPLMGERERELLRQWEENLGRQHEAIILTGFYTNLVPFLTDLSIIHDLDLPIAGSEGLWGCGGKPLQKTEERCWEILAHTSTMILNWILFRKNRRHFPLRPIDTAAIQPLAPQSPADAARTRWFAALYKSRLTQNKITRTLLAMAVNTTARACQVWLDRQKARCQQY